MLVPQRLTGLVVVACCFCGLIRSAASEAPQGAQSLNATDLNNRGIMEAQAGRFKEGAALLRHALSLDPTDALTRKNLSGVLTDWAAQLGQQGKVDDAIAALQEAVGHNPDNGLALVRLGDLFYLKRSDMASAILYWQRAHGKISAVMWQAVANRITQAQRDQLIERGFTARQTAHFDIRFEHSRTVDLEALEHVLEGAYEHLAQQLGRTLPRVTVIVYTEQDLRRVYNQRDWALGLYDGRIRLRLDELTQEYLEDMVTHELAHAFLHYGYGDRLPIWVHEGYAQLQERAHERNEEARRIEQGMTSRTLWIPLKWLDRHFEQPSGADDIVRAYVEARLVVDELVKRYGMDHFLLFLEHIAQGASVDVAYEEAFAPSRWSRADQGVFE